MNETVTETADETVGGHASLVHLEDEVQLERPFGLQAALAEAPHADDGEPVALAIVCTTKQPHNLVTWLRYHREQVGIKRVFLRVEDTPELESLLSNAPWDEFVEPVFASQTHADYILQVDRQVQQVNEAIARARAQGFTHLLHIDDDELLFCGCGARVMYRALARCREAR